MSDRRRLQSVLLAIVVVCLPLFALPGARTATRAASTRVASNAQQLSRLGAPADSDPRFGVVQAFEAPRVASIIGARWERVTFWWRELQPSGPESWNAFATGHDGFIDREVAAGRHLAGVLINTPGWAAAAPGAGGASPPVGLYRAYDDPRNAWGRFVGRMARRYAGRVDDWIVWNEVGIPAGRWHTWAGTRGDYARLVEVASLAAKAANPRARIVLAGDPYWYDRGAWFADLLGRLAAAPGARAHGAYFDVANLHLYSRPTDLPRIVALYRRMLAHAGLSKPIWIAETNAIPYDDPARRYPRSGFFASLDDQASYIVQAFSLGLASGVDRIEVNRMLDGTDFAAGGEPLGLLRNDGTARPALYAYRAVSTLFAHASGGHIAFEPASGVYTVTLHRPGWRVIVVWDQRPVAATTLLSAPAGTAVYDTFGVRQAAQPVGGTLRLSLAPASGNTDTADPADFVIGGRPLIVVQPA